jgi:hypothetical protein
MGAGLERAAHRIDKIPVAWPNESGQWTGPLA